MQTLPNEKGQPVAWSPLSSVLDKYMGTSRLHELAYTAQPFRELEQREP